MELSKVKKHREKSSGKCPPKTFFTMSILSFVGSVLGWAIGMAIASLIRIDIILITLLLSWGGAAGGIFIAYHIFKDCRNTPLFFVSQIPITFFFLLFSSFNPDVVGGWGVAESLGLVCTPLVLHFVIFRNRSYCEECDVSYEDKDLIESETASPFKILAYLQGNINASCISELEADSDFSTHESQKKVELKMSYCPKCYKGIVDANIFITPPKEKGKLSAEEKDFCFYSQACVPERVKELLALDKDVEQEK